MTTSANNLPSSLQNVDPGLRLGDIRGLTDCVSKNQGVNSNGAITASTTQTQAGGTALNYGFNSVSSANASDAVTLPKAVKGTFLVLVNHSGQTIQLFPAVGDTINAALVNAAVTVATATTSLYVCNNSATQWWGGAITNEG